MAHFWNIILTSIVTHGNSDKIRRDKSCHYWRAYLYMKDEKPTRMPFLPIVRPRPSARQRRSRERGRARKIIPSFTAFLNKSAKRKDVSLDDVFSFTQFTGVLSFFLSTRFNLIKITFMTNFPSVS